MISHLQPDQILRWRPGIRLRFDPVRQKWVLLAPERVIFPDPIALAILERIDGTLTLDEMAADLAREFDAPLEEVRSDTLEFLTDFLHSGYLHLEGPPLLDTPLEPER